MAQRTQVTATLGRHFRNLVAPLQGKEHSVEALGLEEFAEKPFRIAILGQTSAGKSALINSIFTSEVSIEKLSADTTDKIYRVSLPNGNVLYDTPGTGGDEDYENIARACLGMPQIDDGARFDLFPVCSSEDGSQCPHIFRANVTEGDKEFEVVCVPKALNDAGFRRLQRRHDEDPSTYPWQPTLCEETHGCSRLKEQPPGSTKVDVVVFLFNAGHGANRTVRSAAKGLRTHCAKKEIPLLWAMTYRRDEKGPWEREKREALEGLLDHGFEDVVPVDCKGDSSSLEGFVRELVAKVPSANVDAFNRQLKERLRIERPTLLGHRIAEAVVDVANVANLRSADEVKDVLVEMKRCISVHYSVDQKTWKNSSSTTALEEDVAKKMDLPLEEARGSVRS